MSDVRGHHAKRGEFRKIQNWIGKPGSSIETASFIPPPPEEVEPCLATWEKFLNESDMPPLITIALAHYQFEAIHPFLDGNGRVGRLLITLFLIERKILPTPLLYLSAFSRLPAAITTIICATSVSAGHGRTGLNIFYWACRECPKMP
jgi:Fic family protein